jgi:glutathione S-transferase
LREISRSVYLEDVLFGKKDSRERFEIGSFIELALRMEAEELTKHINKHLAMRMFIIGQNITAADIVVHLNVAGHYRDLIDF